MADPLNLFFSKVAQVAGKKFKDKKELKDSLKFTDSEDLQALAKAMDFNDNPSQNWLYEQLTGPRMRTTALANVALYIFSLMGHIEKRKDGKVSADTSAIIRWTFGLRSFIESLLRTDTLPNLSKNLNKLKRGMDKRVQNRIIKLLSDIYYYHYFLKSSPPDVLIPVVEFIKKLSVPEMLQGLSNSIHFSPKEIDDVASVSIYFSKRSKAPLTIKPSDTFINELRVMLAQNEPIVELLISITGWSDEKSRDELSGLFKSLSGTAHKFQRLDRIWLAEALSTLTELGVNKTEAACFLHDSLVGLIPDFWEEKVFKSKDHNNSAKRQLKLRAILKYSTS